MKRHCSLLYLFIFIIRSNYLLRPFLLKLNEKLSDSKSDSKLSRKENLCGFGGVVFYTMQWQHGKDKQGFSI